MPTVQTAPDLLSDLFAGDALRTSVIASFDLAPPWALEVPHFGPALLYGTAGLAIAPWRMSVKNTITATELASSSSTGFGVAVGTGIEFQPTPHLGLRAEVMHYGVPMLDLFVPGVGSTSDHFESTAARAGIAWYFN